MVRCVACLLLLSLVAGAHPLGAQTPPADTLRFTLEEAIGRSLEASPEVGQREAQLGYDEARYDEARASRYFTDFEATSAHSLAPGLYIPDDNTRPFDELYLNPDVTNDWGDLRLFTYGEVALTQPLWTWGQLSGSIRAARHGTQVGKAEVRSKELEVALRTGEVYYDVLLTDALSRIIDEAGRTVERAQREVQRLLEEGAEDVDDADLFQVRITEQEYQRRVVELEESRALARSALTRQLFLPDGQLALPDTTVLAPIAFTLDSLDTYLQLGLASRPELNQAEAGLAARNALIKVARADYYPKLVFRTSGSLSFAPGRYRQPSAYVGDSFQRRSTRTGFGIQQNLNFFQTRARVEQAEAERNEVRYQQEGARQLVLFQVEQAYRNVRIARAGLEARDAQLSLSDEWLRTEQINFDLDLGNTENLVDAVQQNLELQAAYYEAVKKYNVAVLRLLHATGVLADPVRAGTLVETL